MPFPFFKIEIDSVERIPIMARETREERSARMVQLMQAQLDDLVYQEADALKILIAREGTKL